MSTITIKFGSKDIQDLTGGALPCEIWVVLVPDADRGGAEKAAHFCNIRTAKQRDKRAREAAQGCVFGYHKRIEIRAKAPSAGDSHAPA